MSETLVKRKKSEARARRKRQESTRERDAKRAAFWSGLLEGFSGPLMMGAVRICPPRRLVVTEEGLDDYANFPKAYLNVGDAVSRALTTFLVLRGLSAERATEKRLDSTGKLRNVERIRPVRKPIRSHVGSSE